MNLVFIYQVNNINLYFKSLKFNNALDFEIEFTFNEGHALVVKDKLDYYTWLFEEFKEELLTESRKQVKDIQGFSEIKTEKLMFLGEI